MRPDRGRGYLATAMLALVAVGACAPVVRRDGAAGGSGGGDPEGGATGTGGVSESGGTPGSGGIPAVGGAGGSGGSGGSTGSGGAPETGGTTAMGGAGGAGGAPGAGGGFGGTTSSVCGIGTSFAWSATQALMDPVSDGSHSLVGLKAPSVVFFGGKYHVFATAIDKTATPTMQHIQFADWPNAGMATADYLDNNAGLAGARSQPQIFYLNAKKTWYLVSQSSGPAYSTSADLNLTSSWTKPANFYGSTPSVVTQNAGAGGTPWTDFWVICNTSNCYLFFSNSSGYLFRAQTSLGSFPSGFGDPVVVMQSATYVAGGPRVYKVNGGSGGYLMLLEGNGSDGRYVGAWTATALDGKWTAVAETESNAFAHATPANGGGNVAFSGAVWTWDVGHGELVRSTYDETMTVDNCNMRYLFAGKDHYAAAKAEPYPWKLGLLVRTK